MRSVCLLLILTVASNTSGDERKPKRSADNANSFHLLTRVTSATWPKLKAYQQNGDIFWGREKADIPHASKSLLFSSYESLQRRLERDSLSNYAALNLDGEYRDYDQAIADVKRIRQLVDKENTRRKTAKQPPLQYLAFFHMRIIDAKPEIVKYPDVVLIGKSYWDAESILGKGRRRRRNATDYLKRIRAAGREPGILLGSPSKESHTAESIVKTISVCTRPVEKGGLGVKMIGFYYERDDATVLLQVLQELRPR